MQKLCLSLKHQKYAPKKLKRPSQKQAKKVVGGVIGGLLGNQFGSGNGRKVMTGLGAIIGVSAATDRPKKTGKLVCKSDGYIAKVTYIHPETQRKMIEDLPLKSRTRAEWVTIPVHGEPVYPD